MTKAWSWLDLAVPDMNLQRFHVDVDTLTYVDRVPTRLAKEQVLFDVDEVIAKVERVQRANLQRLEDDIEVVTKLLKSEGASTSATTGLESLRSRPTPLAI